MSNRESSVTVLGGIGLFDVTFLVFLVLKLTKVIDWSWWWVTAPFWGQFVLVIVAAIIISIIYGILKLIQKIERRKYEKRRLYKNA